MGRTRTADLLGRCVLWAPRGQRGSADAQAGGPIVSAVSVVAAMHKDRFAEASQKP